MLVHHFEMGKRCIKLSSKYVKYVGLAVGVIPS